MENKNTVTIRIRKQTHTLLKIVAALSHESMQDTLSRLVEQEYKKLNQEGKDAKTSS